MGIPLREGSPPGTDRWQLLRDRNAGRPAQKVWSRGKTVVGATRRVALAASVRADPWAPGLAGMRETRVPGSVLGCAPHRLEQAQPVAAQHLPYVGRQVAALEQSGRKLGQLAGVF